MMDHLMNDVQSMTIFPWSTYIQNGANISQIVVAVVAFLAARVALNQLRTSNKHQLAAGFLDLQRSLSEDKVRIARGILWNKLRNTRFTQWADDDKMAAGTVAGNYDSAGHLLKSGYAPEAEFITMYASSVIVCYARTSEFRSERMANTDPDYYAGFDWLAKKSQEHLLKKKKTGVKLGEDVEEALNDLIAPSAS
jgi:hypothetical protein